jgi:hypothetical protein
MSFSVTAWVTFTISPGFVNSWRIEFLYFDLSPNLAKQPTQSRKLAKNNENLA